MYNSSVYSYSLLFRFAHSPASPVHSYGGYAWSSFFSFLSRGVISLTIYRVLILSVAGIRWHNHHRLILWCADYTTTGSSAQRASLTSSVYFLLLFRLLRRSILTATLTPFFLLSISLVREISLLVLSVLWISIWIYKSLRHRLWKRPPERAQRASLTSSVYSYCSFASLFRLLRQSILTATSPTIFYSFYFTCSRDFIIGIIGIMN